jgi:hypothetical protein
MGFLHGSVRMSAPIRPNARPGCAAFNRIKA